MQNDRHRPYPEPLAKDTELTLDRLREGIHATPARISNNRVQELSKEEIALDRGTRPMRVKVVRPELCSLLRFERPENSQVRGQNEGFERSA